MEGKDNTTQSQETTKNKTKKTERQEKIDECITEIHNILQSEKNEEIENQKDAISNFMIDLAKIKEEPERLTSNIESIRKDIKTLKKTPFYKKHKKIINQAIKLLPELNELNNSNSLDTIKENNNYITDNNNYLSNYNLTIKLLNELSTAINNDDQERIEEIILNIGLFTATRENFSGAHAILGGEIKHLQNQFQQNKITPEYLEKMLYLIECSQKKCQSIDAELKENKFKWQLGTIISILSLVSLFIISHGANESLKEDTKELEKELQQTKNELQLKETEMKKLQISDSLKTTLIWGNNGIIPEPTQ